MLSVEECKKHIADPTLTDEQIVRIRDDLYRFVEQALDYLQERGILSNEQTKNKENEKT